MNAISAGQAFVEVLCETQGASKALSAFSIDVDNAAANIRRAEVGLSPRIEIKGIDAANSKLQTLSVSANRSSERIRDAVSCFKRLGATVAAASSVVAFATSLSKTGDDFHKMAQRTGVSVQSLSELGYAAKLSGASLNDVEGALSRMAESVVNASYKGGEAAEAFALLGLSVESIADADPETQLLKIGEAIASLESPTERAAVAAKAFGDAGRRLLPMFEAGSVGLAKMRKEAREYGATLDDDAAQASANYQDAMARVFASLNGLKFATAGLLPVFQSFLEIAAKVVRKTSEWIRNNKELVDKVADVVAEFSAVALITGAVVKGVAKACVAFKGLHAALALLSANPVIAVTAAVVALGAAVAGYLSYKGKLAKESAWSDEKRRILEAGDALREEDQQRMARLEELANKERLTTDEIAEATRLASELNSTYKDLGVSVDAVTGKIELASDAQEKLGKAMRESKLADLDAAIKEAEKNASDDVIRKKVREKALEENKDFQAYEKMKKADSGGWLSGLASAGAGAAAASNSHQNTNAQEKEIAAFRKRVESEFEKEVAEAKKKETATLNALKAQRDVLKETGSEETKKRREEQRKQIEEKNKDERARDASKEINAYSFKSFVETKRADSGKYDRERDAVNDEVDEQRQKYLDAVAPGVDWNNKKEVARWREENPTRSALVDKDLKTLEATRSAKLETIDRAEAADEEKKRQEEQEKAQREQSERDAEAERRKEERDAAERSFFDKFASADERVQRAQQEAADAVARLDEAQKGGSDAAIAKALRDVVGSQNTLEAIEEEIERGQATAADVAVESIEREAESVGTFNAYQAEALGAGDYQRKLFDESRRQTEYLRRLVDVTRGQGAVFV